MRLFIAVEIPDEIRKELNSFMDIPSDAAKVKWVERDNLHLTMKFLGEVSAENLDEVKRMLAKIKFDGFDCSVSGFGAFPSERNARIIWAGVFPHDDVILLHKRIEDSLDGLGFNRDTKFHPHVTLGRVRFTKDARKVSRWLSEIKQSNFSMPFRVGNFVLKKSTLTPDGSVYGNVLTI